MGKSMTRRGVERSGHLTVLVTENERAAVKALSNRQGMSAGALVRMWVREAYKNVFGKEVD
jgi:hypothetical protein